MEPTENPYEYNRGSDTEPKPWEFSGGSETEPRTPFTIYGRELSLFPFPRLRGISCGLRMNVFDDHLTIEGDAIDEPIRIERGEAAKTIKTSTLNINVFIKRPGRPKLTFQCAWLPDRPLKLARLAMWVREYDRRDPEKAFEIELTRACYSRTSVFLMTFGLYAALMFLSSMLLHFLGELGTREIDDYFVDFALFFIGLTGIISGFLIFRGITKYLSYGLVLFCASILVFGIFLDMFLVLIVGIVLAVLICTYLDARNFKRQRRFRESREAFGPEAR